MCLAIPVKVLALDDDESATVDLGGVQKTVSTALLDDVAVGDFVILHAGFALTRLDSDEAERTLAMIAELDAAVPRRVP
jgi:hydrogenase expression/formation protein HypC